MMPFSQFTIRLLLKTRSLSGTLRSIHIPLLIQVYEEGCPEILQFKILISCCGPMIRTRPTNGREKLLRVIESLLKIISEALSIPTVAVNNICAVESAIITLLLSPDKDVKVTVFTEDEPTIAGIFTCS